MKKLLFSLWIVLVAQLANAQDFDLEKTIKEKEIYVETKYYQDELNQEYSNRETSPLDSADFVRFSSLNFFPSNVDAKVTAVFTKYTKQKKFKMKTSGSKTPLYSKYGEVQFKYLNVEYKLVVYQNIELVKKPGYENYLFLPFTDLTNGETTYGGGRYIDLQIPEEKTMVINFNKAYNPYCAYSHKYSCPIPPAENFLNVKIEAGVKEGLTYK